MGQLSIGDPGQNYSAANNEVVRNVLLAVLASLAKLERQKISERTKAGLERARAKGKRLGRAPFSPAQVKELRVIGPAILPDCGL